MATCLAVARNPPLWKAAQLGPLGCGDEEGMIQFSVFGKNCF